MEIVNIKSKPLSKIICSQQDQLQSKKKVTLAKWGGGGGGVCKTLQKIIVMINMHKVPNLL